MCKVYDNSQPNAQEPSSFALFKGVFLRVLLFMMPSFFNESFDKAGGIFKSNNKIEFLNHLII